VGLDLAPANIDACRRLPDRPGMAFARGDAQDLPFPDGSFDAVVNVESSHSYPSVPRFLAEVARVLRPGGLLFLADHRPVADEWGPEKTFASLVEQLRGSGLVEIESRDITANVHESIRLMDDAKQEFLSMTATEGHDLTHLWEVFHCRGSRNYEVFQTGAWRYGSFVHQKPNEG
jgi:SAM-dependent methyltransferase